MLPVVFVTEARVKGVNVYLFRTSFIPQPFYDRASNQ